MKKTAENETIAVLIEKVISKSGYRAMLTDMGEEGSDDLQNIEELISNAITYAESSENPTLEGFLEEVALISDIDNYDKAADAVTLMTIHSAKGLEFPVVFLPGMEENIFPGVQSINDETELEEERRLAYVAVTRAKEKVFISHAHSRLLFGRTSYNQLSRFASEIPNEIIEEERTGFAFNIPPRKSYNTGFDDEYIAVSRKLLGEDKHKPATQIKIPKATPVVSEIFSVGDVVEHSVFGKGFITSVKAVGPDTLYEIAFEEVGTKKIMASYAKLKRV